MKLINHIKLNLLRFRDRYTAFGITIDGRKFFGVDKSSFMYMYEEIFENEIYKFNASTDKPFIIDCGSNIGLSVIYFKTLYPNSTILGFEPDPEIFKVLKKNIEINQLSNITLIEGCLAKEEGALTFFQEGADGGRTNVSDDIKSKFKGLEVKAYKLSSFIDKPVDFLKIDIEGAEGEVLGEISGKLNYVKNIFIEYHSFADKLQNLGLILTTLEKAGFRYYLTSIGVSSAHPFIERNVYSGFDLQVNIFGYK